VVDELGRIVEDQEGPRALGKPVPGRLEVARENPRFADLGMREKAIRRLGVRRYP
jgi:hypothetical protein